jgi:hypothetical protein
MTAQEITMGAGLLPPEHAVDAPAATPGTPATTRRRFLVAAAVASPALFALFVALDPAPLPRAAAEEFLPAIAENTDMFVASTSIQIAAMAAGIALAAMVAIAFGKIAPRLSAATAALLTLGYLGGTGFAGAKLVAADLTLDGAVRPGAEEIWNAVRSGPLFDVLTIPLTMAILGTLLLTVLLVRTRNVVGWWPAVLILVGFVMGSGEFPDAVTFAGPLVQLPAFIAVARLALRDGENAR